MNLINLVFKKALEDLGLDPDEYKLILTKDIPILGINNAIGTACRMDKKIWIKDSLSLKESIKIMLHEVRHLWQFENGYKYPKDKKKMEEDANLYAAKNVIKFYLTVKYGIDELSDLEAMILGAQFLLNINK